MHLGKDSIFKRMWFLQERVGLQIILRVKNSVCFGDEKPLSVLFSERKERKEKLALTSPF